LKAHGWLREIAVPNSRTSTVADDNDDGDDQEVPDVADFNNADNNNAVSPVMLGTVTTNPLGATATVEAPQGSPGIHSTL
jgi:hypothetical protein